MRSESSHRSTRMDSAVAVNLLQIAGSRARSHATWLVLAMVSVTSAACQSSSEIRESPLIFGLVYGRVTNAAGAPVVNAEVHATAHFDTTDCRLGRNGVSGGASVRTDANGFYRDDVTAPVAPTSLCVSVTVVPSQGAAKTIGGGDRSVRLEYQASGRALDSVNVDVRIP